MALDCRSSDHGRVPDLPLIQSGHADHAIVSTSGRKSTASTPKRMDARSLIRNVCDHTVGSLLQSSRVVTVI